MPVPYNPGEGGSLVWMPRKQVKVRSRIRAGAGDTSDLEASLTELGMLHPIVVDTRYRLVSGERRLRAAEALGWSDVPVLVARNLDDAEPALKAELAENLCRRDLTPEEAVKAADRLLPLEKKEAERREKAGRPSDESSKGAEAGRATGRVAKLVGMGRQKYERAAEIVHAAAENPDLKPLVEEMNRTGKVNGAYRKLKRSRKAEELKETAWPVGKFGLLYADPPWQYEHCETETRAIENQYPTMTLADIRALPIPTLCLPDAALFLWATSPKLAEAMTVVSAWDFTYRTCLVWVKDRIGMGYWARQRHELLLVATHGSPPCPEPKDRPDSVIEAPRGAHSAKPTIVYEVLERMFPSVPKVELFSRVAREGWVAWGNEAQ